MAALLYHPRNTRTFERLDGLLTVTSLFKARGTSRDVKMKSVEFLYFYLMPETPQCGLAFGRAAGSMRSVASAASSGYGSLKEGTTRRGKSDTRTMEEKQGMLGRHLSNVEDLVEDLRESTTFGGTVF